MCRVTYCTLLSAKRSLLCNLRSRPTSWSQPEAGVGRSGRDTQKVKKKKREGKKRNRRAHRRGVRTAEADEKAVAYGPENRGLTGRPRWCIQECKMGRRRKRWARALSAGKSAGPRKRDAGRLLLKHFSPARSHSSSELRIITACRNKNRASKAEKNNVVLRKPETVAA